MERLDRELHAGVVRIGKNRGESVGDLLAGLVHGHAGDGSHHEHDHLRADFAGFVHAGAVDVDRSFSRAQSFAGKKPPRTSAGTVIPASRSIFPDSRGPEASSALRQTLIPLMPAREYPSMHCRSDQGLLVAVWIAQRERSVRGEAGMCGPCVDSAGYGRPAGHAHLQRGGFVSCLAAPRSRSEARPTGMS